MTELNNRLKTAAELCRRGVIIVDVGCDHAQLACFLSRTSKKVIASDVRDGPLNAARRTAAELGAENVEIVKSDGLKEIDYADDVVICGMGGELIAHIIDTCRFLSTDTRFILQPMTKADMLRKYLYLNGFEIIEERTAYEGSKAYSVMRVCFTGKRCEIDDIFAITGKITDRNFLSLIVGKLRKNSLGMKQSSNPEKRAEAAKLAELADRIEEKII